MRSAEKPGVRWFQSRGGNDSKLCIELCRPPPRRRRGGCRGSRMHLRLALSELVRGRPLGFGEATLVGGALTSGHDRKTMGSRFNARLGCACGAPEARFAEVGGFWTWVVALRKRVHGREHVTLPSSCSRGQIGPPGWVRPSGSFLSRRSWSSRVRWMRMLLWRLASVSPFLGLRLGSPTRRDESIEARGSRRGCVPLGGAGGRQALRIRRWLRLRPRP